MATIAERVAAGMAFLDDVFPGWEHKINLEVLDLSDCAACVIGQVAGGDAEDGLWSMNLPDDVMKRAKYESWPTAFGFNVQPGSSIVSRRYANLTAGWRRAIRARGVDRL